MSTGGKRGRPAGLLANPVAFEYVLGDRARTDLAAAARVSGGALHEITSGSRGATQATAERIARALGCDAGVIFPELVGFRVAVRVFTAQGVET